MCEIGNLGHLFKAVQVETKYKEYLQSKYSQIDIHALSLYGDKLINIASRRNDAAHGGNFLS